MPGPGGTPMAPCIVEQQYKMGASADWSRARFTLDEVAAEPWCAFVDLYERALSTEANGWSTGAPTATPLFRTLRWSLRSTPPLLQSALSSRMRRAISEIATTAPETMLGDSALPCIPRTSAMPIWWANGHFAAGGPGTAHCGRQLCGQGLWHRRRQDDPRPRPRRLRGGPAP